MAHQNWLLVTRKDAINAVWVDILLIPLISSCSFFLNVFKSTHYTLKFINYEEIRFLIP